MPPVRKPVLPTEIEVEGLLEHQYAHTAEMVTALCLNGAAIDASETGTGKTYTNLVLARELKLRPVVICPKVMIVPWQRAAELMRVEPIAVVNYEKIKRDASIGEFVSLRGRVNAFKYNLPSDAVLLFDEIHKGKGRYTQNGALIRGARFSGIPAVGMSATAAQNPLEMWALGYLLGLFESNYWGWAKRNGVKPGTFGGMVFAGGATGLKKIHEAIFPARGARMRISLLGNMFPEEQTSADSYAVEINTTYEQVLEEVTEEIVDKRGDDQGAVLVAQTRFWQLLEIAKVPLLVSLANNFIEEGSSVAIFVKFTATLEAVAKELNTTCVVSGNQTGDKGFKERQANIDRFQADESRVIVLNIGAGGVGISLHDLNGNFPRVSLICPTFHATDLKQALGRIYRAGAKSKVLQRIIFAAGTVEEAACKAVQKKLTNIQLINDGDLQEGLAFEMTK